MQNYESMKILCNHWRRDFGSNSILVLGNKPNRQTINPFGALLQKLQKAFLSIEKFKLTF